MKGKFWITVGLSVVGLFFAWQELHKKYPGATPGEAIQQGIGNFGQDLDSATK